MELKGKGGEPMKATNWSSPLVLLVAVFDGGERRRGQELQTTIGRRGERPCNLEQPTNLCASDSRNLACWEGYCCW